MKNAQKSFDFFSGLPPESCPNNNGLDQHRTKIKRRSLNLRKSLADLRETVRVENLAMKSNDHDDHKTLKDSVGGWALQPNQLKHLQTTVYEYNASAGSFLEILIMQRFWCWLATFIPKSVAPCTITAIGFFLNLITCSIMISYSPDARGDVPRWALLLCAAGVWLYQIADALDGKQCYKVQNSQIEEFYDHGCDSVSTILLMYSTGIAIQARRWPPLFLLVIFASLFAFYSTHWLNYITRQMVFGRIDVTEAQWTMITIHLISGIFGQSIWNVQIPLWNNTTIELRTVMSLMTLTTLFSSILYNAAIILFHLPTPLEKAGVQIERYRCNPIKPILPSLFLSFLIYYCYNHGYYHLNPAMFVLAFGFNFAKLTMKLVIAHCTNHEFEILDLTLVAPILLALNDCSPWGPSSFRPIISHDQALLCALIWDTIELLRYFTFVSWDLCVALDANIFSIKYPVGHPKNRLQTGGFYVNGLNNEQILNSKPATKSESKEQLPSPSEQ